MSPMVAATSPSQPQPMTPLRKAVVYGGLAVAAVAVGALAICGVLAVAAVAAGVFVNVHVAPFILLGVIGYGFYIVPAGSAIAITALAISCIALATHFT